MSGKISGGWIDIISAGFCFLPKHIINFSANTLENNFSACKSN